MKSALRRVLIPAACLLSCGSHARALEVDSVRLEDSVQVAGKSLILNGAGIGRQMLFRIYAISLYLRDRKMSVSEVLGTDGPRRISIAMLRDVSSDDFREAVQRHFARNSPASLDDGGSGQGSMAAQMGQLARAIASQSSGLKRGDTLTMDWIPALGTVVQLNGRPLAPPLPGMAFYNALLGIWLGDEPADPALKPKLLGGSLGLRASAE